MATDNADNINSNAQKPQSMSVGETSGSQVPLPHQEGADRYARNSAAAASTRITSGWKFSKIKPPGTVAT